MGDFGIGIGIYFDTTRWLAIITFIAGVISSYNIYYYSGPHYSDYQGDVEDFMLKGSAICDNTFWAPCPNCTASDWEDDDAADRYATDITGQLQFALRNDCLGAEYDQGMTQFGIIIVLAVMLQLMSNRQAKTEVALDEDQQTAQDYSVVVDGCPPDAVDPDEWKDFFQDVTEGKVTVVTVAINNANLIDALIEHKILKQQVKHEKFVLETKKLRWKFVGVVPSSEDEIREFLEDIPPLTGFDKFLSKVGMAVDVRSKYLEFIKCKDKIRELSELQYEATDVFVTFETEAAQRKALKALSVGKLALARNKSRTLPDYCKFRGTEILNLIEPAEPSAIRWKDLATEESVRRKGLCISTFLTIVLIISSSLFIIWRVEEGDSIVAIYIAMMNVIVPMLCKKLVSFETHPDEGDRSMSLYFKITLFRWVNTAVIITIATPFTHTLGYEETDLIPQLFTIFFAELVTAPILAMLDIGGTIAKHCTAPRATNQEELNSSFLGTPWEIAERYTTVTKLLFLCFFYAALFPTGYFICSGALVVTYLTDKFCLLRVWKPAPMIGNEVAEINRSFFFPMCILGLLIVNSYHYARFPYDNLCDTRNTVPLSYVGSYNIFSEGNVVDRVEVAEDSSAYAYCNQDILGSMEFPATSDAQGSRKWMTSDQETVVDTIGWSGFSVFLLFVSIKYGFMLLQFIYSIFEGTYEPSGEDMNIDFSTVEAISGYVPEIRNVGKFTFPLIATNFEDIDPMLFEWEDPINGYEKWDLRRELPRDVIQKLKRRKKAEKKPMFSTIKHYPPNGDVLKAIIIDVFSNKREQISR